MILGPDPTLKDLNLAASFPTKLFEGGRVPASKRSQAWSEICLVNFVVSLLFVIINTHSLLSFTQHNSSSTVALTIYVHTRHEPQRPIDLHPPR